ncbi:MAG: HU family DNA-binding protein [Rhodospirillales bacterium]|nr:HU family DNA-binding protein [Rhodospirillales bacterium]
MVSVRSGALPAVVPRIGVGGSEQEGHRRARRRLRPGISSQAAGAVVGAVYAAMAEALARFGGFAMKDRPAGTGRNLHTCKRIAIGPSSGASFRAGKALRDALNR